MKVGSLVIRKIRDIPEYQKQSAHWQRKQLGYGLVLSKQRAGKPEHPCLTVYYPKVGKIYDIAESLMEELVEGRGEPK
tara:strand:+ start:359 stop:592 length:234 start_codon:yes stop_codon:yes gene_type:complete